MGAPFAGVTVSLTREVAGVRSTASMVYPVNAGETLAISWSTSPAGTAIQ